MKNRNKKHQSKAEDEHVDSLYRIYEYIKENGSTLFYKGSILFQYRDLGVMDELLKHFISTEEYEKCSFIQKVIWRLKGVT